MVADAFDSIGGEMKEICSDVAPPNHERTVRPRGGYKGHPLLTTAVFSKSEKENVDISHLGPYCLVIV